MILPLAAALLVLVFAFLAFSIDVGYVAMTRGALQNAADAAALAGAAELDDGPAAVRLETQRIAAQNWANNDRVYVSEADVSLGFWDIEARTFDPASLAPNAVKVITRRTGEGLLFGPVIGTETFDARTEAVAVVHPRDICFVVDLSGSMNDDTEVAWATELLNDSFRGAGYPNIGTQLAADLFEDLGFGEYPGRLEHVGGGLVPEDQYAYANLTKDDGPLANSAVPPRYRILPTDGEAVRKRKCYSALIDHQLRPLMPGVTPPADSLLHYAYWEKYLDYVIQSTRVGISPPPPPRPPSGGGGGGGGGGSSTPPPPSPPPPRPTVGGLEETFPHDLLNERPAGPAAEPAGLAALKAYAAARFAPPRIVAERLAGLDSHRAALALARTAAAGPGDPPGTPRQGSIMRSDWLPPSQDGDRITGMNNPNSWSFPGASGGPVRALRNQLGFLTYAQFLQDFGRDRSPTFGNHENASPALAGKVPLSLASPHVRLRRESVAGREFSFPPRTQPMHALRRGLIAGLDTVDELNGSGREEVRDWVSVVTFDGLGPYHQPEVVFELSPDYEGAMHAVSRMQAVGDVGATTALDPAVLLAQAHLAPVAEGGRGRWFAKKVIVIVSDGIPNAWTTPESEVAAYRAALSTKDEAEFDPPGATWLNAPLMHAHNWRSRGETIPIGMGLGADHDYADRMARLARTADAAGSSARTSGNPAVYEAELRRIFEERLRPRPTLVK